MRPPIIWINGPFGVGKIYAAYALHERLPGSFIFEPEEMGLALKKLTPKFTADPQTHPMWIPLMLDALQYASREADGPLIVPVTITDVARHRRLMSGLQSRDLSVHHFTLLAPLDVVLSRLKREGHTDLYVGGIEDRLNELRSEQFRTHIDVTSLSEQQVAETIAQQVGLTLSPVPNDPLRWIKGALAGRRRPSH